MILYLHLFLLKNWSFLHFYMQWFGFSSIRNVNDTAQLIWNPVLAYDEHFYGGKKGKTKENETPANHLTLVILSVYRTSFFFFSLQSKRTKRLNDKQKELLFFSSFIWDGHRSKQLDSLNQTNERSTDRPTIINWQTNKHR